LEKLDLKMFTLNRPPDSKSEPIASQVDSIKLTTSGQFRQGWGVSLAIHFAIWLAYKLFLYFFNVSAGGMSATHYWFFTTFSTFIEPSIFYSYYLFFIPQWLEKNKIGHFLLVSGILIAFLPIPAVYYVRYLRESLPDLPEALRYQIPYITHHLSISFNLVVFICLASGARFAVDWFENQQLKNELEKQNRLSEAALLRSQINPHFLFNTLNNIYSLAYKQDQNTPAAILKLSELMRYMLHEAGEEKVSLAKEVGYIHNYIELQKLRIKNPLQVNFEIQGDYRAQVITPMLLIPFVENAFKHGVSAYNPSEIKFSLQIDSQILKFTAENAIINLQLVNNGTTEKGIGLQNLQKRLKLLYPEKHAIEINRSQEKYFVSLTLNL
jgi:two-component system, LytTR family, sensor kinase